MQFGPQIPRLAPCARVKGKPSGKESHFIINTKSQADFRGGSGRRGGGLGEWREERGGERARDWNTTLNALIASCWLLIYYIKQIDFMSPKMCSLFDKRRRLNKLTISPVSASFLLLPYDCTLRFIHFPKNHPLNHFLFIGKNNHSRDLWWRCGQFHKLQNYTAAEFFRLLAWGYLQIHVIM